MFHFTNVKLGHGHFHFSVQLRGIVDICVCLFYWSKSIFFSTTRVQVLTSLTISTIRLISFDRFLIIVVLIVLAAFVVPAVPVVFNPRRAFFVVECRRRAPF